MPSLARLDSDPGRGREAALLSRDPSWSGTVQLVFQPAEEGGGGAKSMIADGLFERFPMERIFGYHNWPGLDAGTVVEPLRVGDESRFAVHARGAHVVQDRAGIGALDPELRHERHVHEAHALADGLMLASPRVEPVLPAPGQLSDLCLLTGPGVPVGALPAGDVTEVGALRRKAIVQR